MDSGCLRSVFIALPLGAAFAYWLIPLFGADWPSAAAILIGSVTCALGVESVLSGTALLRDRRLLDEKTIPRDGERAVAAGPIAPIASPLRTPFASQPAVIYHYSIYEVVRRHDRTHSTRVAYSGIAMCPCHILTSAGPIRLLSPPDLIASRNEYFEGKEAEEKASAIIRCARFEERTAAEIGECRTRLLAEETVELEYHFKRIPSQALHHPRCEASFVAPNDPVCVFGRYSEASGAIMAANHPPLLVLGTAEEVRAALDVRICWRLFIGAALFAAGVAAGHWIAS